jgi:hypothetical protein
MNYLKLHKHPFDLLQTKPAGAPHVHGVLVYYDGKDIYPLKGTGVGKIITKTIKGPYEAGLALPAYEAVPSNRKLILEDQDFTEPAGFTQADSVLNRCFLSMGKLDSELANVGGARILCFRNLALIKQPSLHSELDLAHAARSITAVTSSPTKESLSEQVLSIIAYIQRNVEDPRIRAKDYKRQTASCSHFYLEAHLGTTSAEKALAEMATLDSGMGSEDTARDPGYGLTTQMAHSLVVINELPSEVKVAGTRVSRSEVEDVLIDAANAARAYTPAAETFEMKVGRSATDSLDYSRGPQ